MDKNKKVWIGIVSFGLAALLFFLLLVIQIKAKEEPVYERVVCVRHAIPYNTCITQQNMEQYLEEKQIPQTCLPKQYFSQIQELKEFVSKVALPEGTILTQELFTEYKEYYQDYEKLTFISVPIEQLYEGVAGSLRAGDYIDIYTITKNDLLQEFSCDLLAEGIRIEAAYSQQGALIGQDSDEGLSQLIVIPMEKEQVAWFYEILAQGNIRIAKYETA